jgi:hypothetical protein
MIANKLFDTQLFLFRNTVLVLSYKKGWRGVLMKLFVLFEFFLLLMRSVFNVHVIFVTGKSIEDMGDSLSVLAAVIEAMAKMSTFYLMRKTLQVHGGFDFGNIEQTWVLMKKKLSKYNN